MPKSLLVALITITFALPAFGYTYKTTYTITPEGIAMSKGELP
jgi:hypothetical protein